MASYRKAIEWIADNDDADLGDDELGYLISIEMVADLFGKSPDKVCRDVLRRRELAGASQ